MKTFCKLTTQSPAASYVPLPRFLLQDEALRDISNDAKVLYALLLDRASISRQNGYVEPDGTIRLYFTLEQAQTKLHRSRQSATRIFSTRTGGPMDRHNVARALREYSDKAKIERRGPHALRHTFATRWIQSGKDPVTLSKILGHSNSNFTMRVYVHADDTSKKQGMECMADLI